MSHAPREGPQATAEAMLNFAVALGARSRGEVYLSTPITTGHAFVQWRRSESVQRDHPTYNKIHREVVVDRNIARTAPLAAKLRKHFSDRVVINPADLVDIDHWAQEDYLYLWCSTIDRFAEVVVFADGWQYSRGCVEEFVTSLKAGVQTLDQDLKPLSSDAGHKLIADAIESLDDLDEDTAKLRQTLAKLIRTTS